MRAVGSPVTLGTAFGTPEAPGSGTQTPGATGDRDAGARALPFAAMLATRLARPAAGPTSSPSEAASDRDDDAMGAEAEPDSTALAAGLLPAPGAAVIPATRIATAPSSTTTSTADVRHVSRDVNALAPALRDRLGRVVARMQREYGHDVQIAEAGRTQARQDYLFTQGRTRSGPVVTWTRDSAHTRGRAVDVTIDGGYDNAAAFARLQQIAQSESLRTLGARDPGHLELPRDVPGDVPALAFGDDAATRVTVESFGVRTEPGAAAAPPAGAVAPVALVAPVAAVAAVAQVATVAGGAVPRAAATPAAGVPTRNAAPADAHADARGADRDATRVRPSRDPDGGLTTSTHTSNAVAAAAFGAAPRDGGERSGDRPGGGGADAHKSRATAAPHDMAPAPASPSAGVDVGTASPAGALPSPASPASAASTPAGGPVLGAVAAERIARVLDAQQAAAPRTVSHLTLRVERADGGDDRIRLDLRGRAVEAHIDVADLGAADHLAAHTPELRAALAQHGLTTDDVRVRSAGVGSLDTLSLSTSTPGLAARAGTGFDTSSQQAGDGARGDASQRDSSSSERQPDDRPPGGAPRDGTAADGGARDQRRDRRPAPDAYLDLPTTRAAGRASR